MTRYRWLIIALGWFGLMLFNLQFAHEHMPDWQIWLARAWVKDTVSYGIGALAAAFALRETPND
jgi:hypothetical protein